MSDVAGHEVNIPLSWPKMQQNFICGLTLDSRGQLHSGQQMENRRKKVQKKSSGNTQYQYQ